MQIRPLDERRIAVLDDAATVLEDKLYRDTPSDPEERKKIRARLALIYEDLARAVEQAARP